MTAGPGTAVALETLADLLDHLGAPEHTDELARSWRELVDRTWGKPEMKLPGARDAITHEIAAKLPEAARSLLRLAPPGPSFPRRFRPCSKPTWR